MITDQQVRLLRQKRMEGKTQETSAAMAGMSQRSARKWQCGPLPSESKQERWARTRPDPFDGVWEEEILPLLRGPDCRQAQSKDNYRVLYGKLRRRDSPAGSASPGCAPCNGYYRPFGKLRRRALNGPDQEVYFPQEHSPGHEAQIDFTHCNSLGVTIGGRPYRHLLFQMVLSHSGWRYAEVANGETFLALKQGL